MFLATQPYKGSRDFYPEDKRVLNWIFEKLRKVAQGFGYQEYDGPLLEPFDLYAAKSGEEIVQQQLYSFLDRGERKVAIRPEMTPTLARMVAARFQELPKPIRWFSLPNVWRYERPQKGRLREHWQANVDILGGDSLLADAEILTLALRLFEEFNGLKHFRIRLNNRALVNFVFQEKLGLAPENAQGLSRIIDAKEKFKEDGFEKALTEFGLGAKARNDLDAFFKCTPKDLKARYPGSAVEHLGDLLKILEDRGFSDQVSFDPTIMRGLDYYTGTVFEAFDLSTENNRALFGGGRYDNLVGLFGKNQLSGMGFGLGDVTLTNFLTGHGLLPDFGSFGDIYLCISDPAALKSAAEIAQELRLHGIRVIEALNTDGFSSQLKAAVKLKLPFALLLGSQELASGILTLKELGSGQQISVKRSELGPTLYSKLKAPK